MSSQDFGGPVLPGSEGYGGPTRRGFQNTLPEPVLPVTFSPPHQNSFHRPIFQVEIQLNHKDSMGNDWLPIRALFSDTSEGCVLLDSIGVGNVSSKREVKWNGKRKVLGVRNFGFHEHDTAAGHVDLDHEDVHFRKEARIRRYEPGKDRSLLPQHGGEDTRSVKVSVVSHNSILKSNYCRATRGSTAANSEYAKEMGWDIVLDWEFAAWARSDFGESLKVFANFSMETFPLGNEVGNRSRVDWEYVPSEWRSFWPDAKDQYYDRGLEDVRVHERQPSQFRRRRHIIPVKIAQHGPDGNKIGPFGERNPRQLRALISLECPINIVSHRLMRLLQSDGTMVSSNYPEFFSGFIENSRPNRNLELGRSWFGDPCKIHLSHIEQSDHPNGEESTGDTWSGEITVFPMQWNLLRHTTWARSVYMESLLYTMDKRGWDIMIGFNDANRIKPWSYCPDSWSFTMSSDAGPMWANYWGHDKRSFSAYSGKKRISDRRIEQGQ